MFTFISTILAHFRECLSELLLITVNFLLELFPHAGLPRAQRLIARHPRDVARAEEVDERVVGGALRLVRHREARLLFPLALGDDSRRPVRKTAQFRPHYPLPVADAAQARAPGVYPGYQGYFGCFGYLGHLRRLGYLGYLGSFRYPQRCRCSSSSGRF